MRCRAARSPSPLLIAVSAAARVIEDLGLSLYGTRGTSPGLYAVRFTACGKLPTKLDDLLRQEWEIVVFCPLYFFCEILYCG